MAEGLSLIFFYRLVWYETSSILHVEYNSKIEDISMFLFGERDWSDKCLKQWTSSLKNSGCTTVIKKDIMHCTTVNEKKYYRNRMGVALGPTGPALARPLFRYINLLPGKTKKKTFRLVGLSFEQASHVRVPRKLALFQALQHACFAKWESSTWARPKSQTRHYMPVLPLPRPITVHSALVRVIKQSRAP